MKAIWKWLAWIFFICGFGAYLLAWTEAFTGAVYWNMTSTSLFYDSIATGIFGLFFLAWGWMSAKGK